MRISVLGKYRAPETSYLYLAYLHFYRFQFVKKIDIPTHMWSDLTNLNTEVV